ncbi:MAG TPA: formimidoylglutamate deiminase [Rhizomicrobium sp.]|nr:formimidoylglutamate deiminase [Rhizomicrobium sp.]
MPLWFETALLPQGWTSCVRVRLANGRITQIETAVQPDPTDEQHAIGIPGLANVHSHGFQRGMAGLAEVRGPLHDNFWTWREVMYRFVNRLQPEQIEAITAQAYVEMLESGFTRVGEFHYLHHDVSGAPYANLAEMADRIAAAADATGIGLTLLPVFYAHSNFGGAPPKAGQRRFINTPEQFGELMKLSRKAVAALPDAQVGIAPHSLRAVTPDELNAILPLADGSPIHIHAAEQMKEVDDCRAWSGKRPLQWLLDNTEMDAAWCVIHATHLTPAEVSQLAKSAAVAGLCPMTEANLGDGIFRTQEYLSSGGRIAVGTDSNVQIHAAAELRSLEYAQRLISRTRNVLARAEGESVGRHLFEATLAGGAQALGQAESGLREGAPADLVSLDANDPHLVARKEDAILDSWIFANAEVDCVWRAGRKVVEAGRHIARDSVAAAYAKAIESVLN